MIGIKSESIGGESRGEEEMGVKYFYIYGIPDTENI